MPNKMSVEMANEVYDILVAECLAQDREEAYDRFGFIQAQTEGQYFTYEFRFCGALGFGGKFWVNDNRLYVTCYPESETPEINEMISKANERLAAAHKKYNYNMHEV